MRELYRGDRFDQNIDPESVKPRNEATRAQTEKLDDEYFENIEIIAKKAMGLASRVKNFAGENKNENITTEDISKTVDLLGSKDTKLPNKNRQRRIY